MIRAISYGFKIVDSGLLLKRMDRMDPFMVIQIISAISYGFEIVCSGFLVERMDPFMVIKDFSSISYGFEIVCAISYRLNVKCRPPYLVIITS
jgi:hypothetical protein